PDSVWFGIILSQLFKTDRLAVASRTVELALAEARRRGSAPGFAAASSWRAWIALREGRGHDAEADARAAVDCLSEPTWPRVGATAFLAEVLVERGALDEARALLEQGPGIADTDGGAHFFIYVHSIVREASADVEGALDAQLAWRRTIEPDPDFDGWLRIA